MTQSISPINLFGGTVRNLSVSFGFNSNSSVITTTIIAPKGGTLTITSREVVDITVGSLFMRGIVQSWDEVKIDVAGTGIYQVRISDTKPVLDSVSVYIGSELDVNYGDNIIAVEPENSDDLQQGIDFDNIKSAVESSTIKYGSTVYRVSFDFTLPRRGTNSSYRVKPSSISLVELITQITNDHGLDWVLTTDTNNVIHINTISRSNDTAVTLDSLKDLHPEEIIRLREGKENRDAVLKVSLVGAYRNFLNNVNGSVWSQFWGMSEIGLIVTPRVNPVFSRTDMERIINKDYDDDEYTQENIQQILNYANEFWGRKFIAPITPFTAIDSNNESWVVPASAGWWEELGFPANLDEDGQLKFQNDDGRWVSFVQIPFAGTRFAEGPNVTYQWDNSLFSNTNTHVTFDKKLFVKAKLEIIGKHFILTVATPLRLKKRTEEEDENTGQISEVFKQTRFEALTSAYIALTDQRDNYGPWFNRFNSIGRTELSVDNSLSPWNFGYRGITNAEGVAIMTEVARAKIKTVEDLTIEADIFELEVASTPKINIGTQISTGLITNISVRFGVDSVTTVYSSKQFTNELSRHQKYYQDLVDRLRRESSLNNSPDRPEQEFGSPETDLGDKGDIPLIDRDTQRLGKINARVSGSEPKYNLTPMAWRSDAFGELTLVRDPSVFGEYLRVVNMSEKQTAPGRLEIGLVAEVKVFSRTAGGIESYYIETSANPPQELNALIGIKTSNGQPRYRVTVVEDGISEINLTSSEQLALSDVLNIGEPSNFGGNITEGEVVVVHWNENSDGTYTPFINRQLNLFNPPS